MRFALDPLRLVSVLDIAGEGRHETLFVRAAPFPLAVAAKAQTKADEQAVRRLLDAWAKHDGHELAKIMGDDLDFATVATTCRRGRAGARNSTFDFQRALPGIQHQTTVRFCGLIRRLALSCADGTVRSQPR